MLRFLKFFTNIWFHQEENESWLFDGEIVDKLPPNSSLLHKKMSNQATKIPLHYVITIHYFEE